MNIVENRENQKKLMKVFEPILHLFLRFRYPVSMPADVAADLGLNISNYLTFTEFMDCLTDPSHRPTKLKRFMPRDQAEDIFRLALRKERFQQNSLFSYHFKEKGWVEIALQFDEKSRLRRIYIRHKDLKQKHEISISP
jgi:hypothetical protein